MNLQAVLGIVRAIGLCAAVALVGCDSGEKKAEAPKTEEKKVEAKAEEKKAEAPKPEEKKADVAEMKAADPAANAGDPGANAGAGGNADAAKAAGDAKAEGDAKAGDAKAEGDAKAGGEAKAADKKGADKKGAEKADDKSAGIDGKALYLAKCKVCHAEDGKGTEAMKKNNVPDMTTKDFQAKHSKAAIAKAIEDGVEGSKMKPFKGKLKPEEIDAIAAYVKKMKS